MSVSFTQVLRRPIFSIGYFPLYTQILKDYRIDFEKMRSRSRFIRIPLCYFVHPMSISSFCFSIFTCNWSSNEIISGKRKNFLHQIVSQWILKWRQKETKSSKIWTSNFGTQAKPKKKRKKLLPLKKKRQKSSNGTKNKWINFSNKLNSYKSILS